MATSQSSSPIRVAVTGAAGNIGYATIFRLASGAVFGPNQPIALNLIEVAGPGLTALTGVVMELKDCAFPLLTDIVATGDINEGFRDTDWCLLIGAVPRKEGMERKDLLGINGKIFISQGDAIARYAKKSVKVLVVGNPCNTNALIALHSAAGSIPAKNFFAMTRLDENRAKALLAEHSGFHCSTVKNVVIWGNHSSTQYPDISNATICGMPATQIITDHAWRTGTFVTLIQKRGAAVIKTRGASSAASAANAIVDTLRSLHFPTPIGEWHSVAVISNGEYGVRPGIVFGYPLQTLADGSWEIVKDLTLDNFSRDMIAITEKELLEERIAASEALGIQLL
jgi:malate dehydrogenase